MSPGDAFLRGCIAFAIAAVLAMVLLKLLGCGGSADLRARVALDVLADTIDPAYALAMDGCAERELVQLDAVKAGITTTAKAGDAIGLIRERCDALREAFERMRVAHTKAVERVNAGAVQDAERLLAQIRGQWVELGRGMKQ